MPLNPKAPTSENIRELHSGKTYAKTKEKYGKERANKQAIAIALDVARRVHKANGGALSPPWYVRNEARNMTHVGPLISKVAGRTDHIATKVPANSYVVPADIISGLGQGNTLAGMQIMHHMFGSGPMGMRPPSMGRPMKAPRMKFADGGMADSGEPVDVMVAGGEYVIPPEKVAEWGEGDVNVGHAALDKWVVATRKKINTEQRKLPGPAKD